MSALLDQSILAAWRTNQRVTAFLVEGLPSTLWSAGLPGAPRRTVQRAAAHIHNVRCRWVRTLGASHGIVAPPLVDAARVSRRDLVSALRRSGRGIHELLVFAFERGGTIPAPSAYVWRNLPLDAAHVLTYFVAHEAHHRGQIVMAARAAGHRLPPAVVNGLWEWTARSRETRRAPI